jgi:hypothetical protein
MTRESLRVLSKQGVVDKSGASPESEIPRDAFVVSSVALARLFPGGKIELGELKALVPDFTHLLSTSPDPLLARTTRSLMKMGEAVTRIGNSLVDPATVEAAALLRDSVHSHAEQHYPSFNGEPPLRKVAVDLGKKRTPEAIAQLFEILPEGDSRSWGRHVVTEDVYRTIKEHNAWGLFCALVERGGNAPGIRYAFEVSYEMDFAKLSAAELKRLRQALKALPKRIPEIHLGEAIGDRLILRGAS